ncbi:hypothetical protein [Cellulosilyticum ruminicola]|uniref:hypothetical protein n=1 Tax=Cellulosilyticum ruminicola TaxID=425254 RepID=UPI0006D1C32F|nr:hypothetical protein [Cellulosilyticum ruminicola]
MDELFKKEYVRDVTLYKQNKGIDQDVEALMVILNVREVISEGNLRPFIVKITAIHKGYTYHYTHIFNANEVDDEGEVIVGNVYMIGPIELSKVEMNAEIAFLEAVN